MRPARPSVVSGAASTSRRSKPSAPMRKWVSRHECDWPSSVLGAKPKAQSAPVAKAEVAEEVAEPTKRVSKKAAEPVAKKDFVDVLNTWTDDE